MTPHRAWNAATMTTISCGAVLGVLLSITPALAQVQRDPTVPPLSALAAAASAAERGKDLVETPLAVIVREGRSYVVVGGRLLAQGQMLGDARIERITETEIWLREGKLLRKIPRFSGIQRKVLP